MKNPSFKQHLHYSYEELAGEFDIIDMRGRELQVSTFYRPPMIYVSRMIEKVINGTVEEVFPADNGKLEYLNR